MASVVRPCSTISSLVSDVFWQKLAVVTNDKNMHATTRDTLSISNSSFLLLSPTMFFVFLVSHGREERKRKKVGSCDLATLLDISQTAGLGAPSKKVV